MTLYHTEAYTYICATHTYVYGHVDASIHVCMQLIVTSKVFVCSVPALVVVMCS